MRFPFALLDQKRHLFQSRGAGERAIARRVVLLLQQREDAVAAFVDVGLRIGFFKIDHAIKENYAVELSTKQQPVDAIVLAPLRGLHRVVLWRALP